MRKVGIKLSETEDPFEIEVDEKTKVKDIVDRYQKNLPYKILAVKIDNKIKRLNYEVRDSKEIILLDQRNHAANLMYQRSATFIYLKAVRDVLGKVEVDVNNSLNKGLYTEIHLGRDIGEDEVWEIEDRMKEIVEEDIPIIKETVTRETAYNYLIADGHREKTRLLENAPDIGNITFYGINGFRNYFYGPIVTSTGYIEIFELRKYKNGILLRLPQPGDPTRLAPYEDEVLLYEAFADAKKWGDLMNINFVADLNDTVKDPSRALEMIQLSEALHEKHIAHIADKIARSRKRVVLIAGPSSSGKTTFARRLNIQLKINGLNPIYLGTDDYFVERKDTPKDEYGEYNFEDLDAVDIDLFNDDINSLLIGEMVDLPTFDFVKGQKVFGLRHTKIKENQPIVIEGIHALNNVLTSHIDDDEKFKIYISPLTQLNIDDHNRISTTDVRMLRRAVRDNRTRGNSVSNTIKMWPKIRVGENKNIFPYSNSADVFFNSVHIYELAVIKKYAEPLLKEVTTEDPAYSEANRLIRFLSYFETIEDDDGIVNNSILKEFIGGSVFV